MNSNLVEIEVEFIAEREHGFVCKLRSDGTRVEIEKSQVHRVIMNPDHTGSVFIPRWQAINRDLI